MIFTKGRKKTAHNTKFTIEDQWYDTAIDACDNLLESKIGLIEWLTFLQQVLVERFINKTKSYQSPDFCKLYIIDEDDSNKKNNQLIM